MTLDEIKGLIESQPLNDIFDDVADFLNQLATDVADLKTNKATKTEIVKEIDLLASNIVNDTAGVTGEYVSNALLGLKNRIDNIIAQSGTSDTEVVDARYSPYYDTTSTVFTDRITNVENKKAEETMITNSFHADLEKYYGNVKTIDDFQDISNWSATNANISLDNSIKKIEDYSINVSPTSIGFNSITLNNVNYNFSELNNKQPSGLDDFIVVGIYISDISKIDVTNGNAFTLRLGNDSTYNDTNRVLFNDSNGIDVDVDLKTGWNYLELKKSDGGIDGTGDFSDVKSILLGIVSNDINVEVYFQLLQLVKKDPLADYPNPFQVNGVREWDITQNEFVIAEEYGKIKLIGIGNEPQEFEEGLVLEKTFDDFIATARISSSVSNDVRGLSVKYGTQGRLSAFVSDDKAQFYWFTESGVGDNVLLGDINVDDDSFVKITLEKDGSDVYVKWESESGELVQYKHDIGETAKNIKLVLNQRNTDTTSQYYESISITEISHASHSDLSETSKSLIAQAESISSNTSLQSLSSGTTDQGLTLDSDEEEYFFDSNSPLERTIRESGKYLITLNADYESNTTGSRDVKIKINNTQVSHDSKLASSAGETGMSCSVVRKMSVGDIVTLTGWQNSGVSLDIATTLEITKVF